MAKTCSVSICGKKVFAKTFCSVHYRRFKLYGNPLGHADYEEKRRKNSEWHKGRKLSDEHKKSISISLNGKKKPIFSTQHIENLRKSHLGKKLSDSQKKKISDSLKGHKTSEQTREKISKSTKGKKRNEQSKKNISTAQKQRFQNPKELEKSRLRGLEIQSRPEVKAKVSKSLKVVYAKPEMKEIQRLRRYNQKSTTESRNEILVQAYLKENNINFQKHHTIKFTKTKWHQPDLLILPNKIIEIFGDYYHANPMNYAPDDIISGIRNANVN